MEKSQDLPEVEEVKGLDHAEIVEGVSHVVGVVVDRVRISLCDKIQKFITSVRCSSSCCNTQIEMVDNKPTIVISTA